MSHSGPSVAIKKSFQGTRFSLDLAFEAPAGITILFGPSGSGKTTLLRAIAGIEEPDEGRISLGSEVFFDSARGVRMRIQQRRVGYVFQSSTLFPHMTALDNVAYGAPRACVDRNQRARELLDLFKVEHAARQFPRELSGGEAQRVALARALASDPSLMLLDEPLSALDAPARALVLAEIRLAQETSGIPFLYVTHQRSEALELGSYAIILKEGRLVGQGPPGEVLLAAS